MDQIFPRPDAPSITRAPLPGPAAGRRPDPGSRLGAWVGGILAFSLILMVAVMQQTAGSAVQSSGSSGSGPSVIEPPSVLFDVMSRIYVKLGGVDPSGAAGPLADAVVPELDAMADTPEARVRVAIVAAEFGRAEEAVRRLTEVRDSLPADSPLIEDVEDLIPLYQPPTDAPSPLEQGDIDRLVSHHGWFGELAAAYGKPAADPWRQRTAGGGAALMGVLLLVALAVVLALLSGLVLLIVGVVMAASGRLKRRFIPPAPGGSVAIETVAVFAAAFIVMKAITELLAPSLGSEQAVLVFTLSAQWLLVLTILWPVVRGVRARDGLALFGLHRGEGVLKEIGCGIVGYLACLPFMLLGVLITLVLVMVMSLVQQAQGQKPVPPENTVIDLVGQHGSPGVLVLLFLLAALWAPLVEETIFRGALYRHLRTRWVWFPAGLVVALAFGAMHGYALPLLFPVIGLGFGFSLLREWRGSIIACMTAHCIHNAATLTLMLVVLRLLGM